METPIFYIILLHIFKVGVKTFPKHWLQTLFAWDLLELQTFKV